MPFVSLGFCSDHVLANVDMGNKISRSVIIALRFMFILFFFFPAKVHGTRILVQEKHFAKHFANEKTCLRIVRRTLRKHNLCNKEKV